jgi:hypothetical protein
MTLIGYAYRTELVNRTARPGVNHPCIRKQGQRLIVACEATALALREG